MCLSGYVSSSDFNRFDELTKEHLQLNPIKTTPCRWATGTCAASFFVRGAWFLNICSSKGTCILLPRGKPLNGSTQTFTSNMSKWTQQGGPRSRKEIEYQQHHLLPDLNLPSSLPWSPPHSSPSQPPLPPPLTHTPVPERLSRQWWPNNTERCVMFCNGHKGHCTARIIGSVAQGPCRIGPLEVCHWYRFRCLSRCMGAGSNYTLNFSWTEIWRVSQNSFSTCDKPIACSHCHTMDLAFRQLCETQHLQQNSAQELILHILL